MIPYSHTPKILTTVHFFHEYGFAGEISLQSRDRSLGISAQVVADMRVSHSGNNWTSPTINYTLPRTLGRGERPFALT
jgi:hypothetical protein